MSLTSSAKRHGAWGGGNRDGISEKVSRSHMKTVQKEGLRGAYSTGRAICDKINENLKFQKKDCDVVINAKASCL